MTTRHVRRGELICGEDVGPQHGGIVYCGDPASYYTDKPFVYGLLCEPHATTADQDGYTVTPIADEEG